MKITFTPRKPRNAFASLARMRQAGSHRAGDGAARQQARRALRGELQQLKHSP